MAGSTSDQNPAHHHSKTWAADTLNANPPSERPCVAARQSRVSRRCVTRCGRAASTPSRSTLFSS
jgi:hypothetical protein